MELGFAFFTAPGKTLNNELKELPLKQFLKEVKQFLKELKHECLI
jgi:hypothetical protein